MSNLFNIKINVCDNVKNKNEDYKNLIDDLLTKHKSNPYGSKPPVIKKIKRLQQIKVSSNNKNTKLSKNSVDFDRETKKKHSYNINTDNKFKINYSKDIDFCENNKSKLNEEITEKNNMYKIISDKKVKSNKIKNTFSKNKLKDSNSNIVKNVSNSDDSSSDGLSISEVENKSELSKNKNIQTSDKILIKNKIIKTKKLININKSSKIKNSKNVTSVEVNEDVFSKYNFASLSLKPNMVSNLEKIGIKVMTAVQQRSIPEILNCHDLLIKSQTGSGKTLSYAIPIIEQLSDLRMKRSDGPYCIVIVPTRELVLQTYKVIHSLVQPFIWVVPGYLMGGEKRKSEKARLRRGINVIISTPGRLVDHMDNTNCLQLDNIRYLVIDEADRMLDMGFEKDVARIITVLLKKRKSQTCQTILLSATLTPGVEKLAGMSLKDPVRIDMSINEDGSRMNEKDEDDDFVTPSSLKHNFVNVPTKLRLVTLASFILWKLQLSSNPCKAIVFLSTQDSVEFHHQLLQTVLFSPEDDDDSVKHVELFKLYGDMPQKDRTHIFSEFHAAKSGVLLCTDVASRGLDLPHVDWIVQYNTPGTARDYIHRVGRTARIGTKGNAIVFLSQSELEYVDLLKGHKIKIEEIPIKDILNTLIDHSKKGLMNLEHKGNHANTTEDAAAYLQLEFEGALKQNMNLRTLARKAYQSSVRAYAGYPQPLKKIFHVGNLHLGHLASSFALTEAPSIASRLVSKFSHNAQSNSSGLYKNKGRGTVLKRKQPYNRINGSFGSGFNINKRSNFADISEFGSGT